MAAKETINIEVKSDIKEVSQDASGLVSEFKIMGVSLNSVKASFASVGKAAKASFATIKAGIASTGIGLFVIAIGSLVTYFTQTEKGAEKLKVIFAGVGAGVSVITDRISKFGGGVFKFFKGDFKGAGKDMKDTFKGIGAEIAADVALITELEKRSNALQDSERALNVETAQRRAQIEQLKMIAEDVTKTEEERLAAAEKAFNIEQELLDKRVANAKEAVEIAKQQVAASESSEEDLDNLAQKEIDLANIRGESATKQIELNNKINSIKQETINKNNEIKLQQEAEIKATKDLTNDLALLRQKDAFNRSLLQLEQEKKAKIANEEEVRGRKLTTEELLLIEQIYQEKYLDLVDQKTIEVQGSSEAELLTDEEVAARKIAIYQKMYANISSVLMSNLQAQSNAIESEYNKEKALAEANGKDTEAIEAKYESKRTALAEKQKKVKIGLATVDMYQSVIAAYNQGMGVPPPAGLILGPASAALALAAGLANINAIMQTDVGAGGGGGGGSVAGGAIGGSPAPQMMSGAFELTGGQEVDPIQAYVVSDDITNNQNALAIIRRRATI